MSFSNIRNDIENAISGTGAEINRCREFWHDEGGTLFEENILNTILSHQKSMREQTEQAENRENGIDRIRTEIEACITAARTRDSSQNAVNEQLRLECETLIEKCQSTVSAAKQLSDNESLSLDRELGSLRAAINNIPVN